MNGYLKIKRAVLKIIPKHLLFRYEYRLRFFYYMFYAGNRYKCNICNKGIKSFVNVGKERLCPRCGSLQRNRRLWQLLDGEFLIGKMKILDFSPSRSLFRLMKSRGLEYVSSDLSGDFISDVSFDIKNIDSVDDDFDLIICYHILEHIDDDEKAMAELFRVLKNGGCCIVQTPFKDGEIYENESVVLPIERERHFGQSDHVRVYSVSGLVKRLEHVGFAVEVREFNCGYDDVNGFEPNETVLICKKV